MVRAHPRSKGDSEKPTWQQVKARLEGVERAGLLALLQDLYRGSQANQRFLQARFELGADPLRPYKKEIARWLFPDFDEEYSIAKAKAVISAYRAAVGAPGGLADLKVFFCEQASEFCVDVGLDDLGFYDALGRMFRDAIQSVALLPPEIGGVLWVRLQAVRDRCQDFGFGAGDEICAPSEESAGLLGEAPPSSLEGPGRRATRRGSPSARRPPGRPP
jgi:hypothetical protein